MTELKYGIFTSFLLFIWMILVYTLIIPNFHQSKMFIGFLALIFPAIGIYFGIKERRDKTNFGFIKFKDAFRTGIVITFILTVMIVLFTYVYYKYVNPDYVNEVAYETEKALMQENLKREIIDAEIAEAKYKFRFDIQIIQQLLYVLIGGTLISAIASFLLKKEKRD